MIRKIISTLILCFSFVCVSCGFFTEKNFGFPSKVQFTNEGGEMTVRGNEYVGVQIQTYKSGYDINKRHISNDGEYEFFEYDWLKVKSHINGSKTVTMYVAPNTTGKKRKLYIELISGYEYDVIKVEQDK